MKSIHVTCVAILAAGMVAFGCDKSPSGSNTGGTNSGTNSLTDMANKAAGSASDAMESAKDAAGDMASQAIDSVVKPMQTQLQEWAGKIENLKSGASALGNADLNAMVANVTAKYEEVKSKIDAAMGGDTSAIEALKADGSAMMDSLKGVYEDAMAKLKALKPAGMP